MISTMQSHLFRAESGISTHYIECGNLSGSLIILLHGLGGSTATFDALIPSIPLEKYRVIAVDFEGFGKSALCNKTISVERLVWNLSELIESLHQTQRPEPAAVSSFESPVIIVGHSLGSIIALHYAASKPDNVKSLGLIGAGRSASHISAARQRMLGLAEMVRNRGIVSAAELAMKTNFAADEENSPLQREAVRKAVAASDPEAYALTCEAIVDPSHKDPDYSKITCPTVFICGNGDTLSPPERSHDLKKLLGGSSEVSVVRGGHQPILSDLEGTKTAIARLFELVKDQ